jgi:hypothetical protein
MMPKGSKYHQGRFHPQNPEKYMGDARNIIYRSSWELHFLKWCDRNDAVLKYASEEFSIPYVSPVDNRVHRYYPDGIVQIRHQDGRICRYIIEIKPAKQCVEPKKPSRVTKSYINECKTYAVNQAKWEAGESFAKDNGIQFKVLTEHDLGISAPRKRRRK